MPLTCIIIFKDNIFLFYCTLLFISSPEPEQKSDI